MKIDQTALDRMAELARLDISDPAEREGLLADMQRVIDFVERLNSVDVAGVEPLIFLEQLLPVWRKYFEDCPC